MTGDALFDAVTTFDGVLEDDKVREMMCRVRCL